MLSFKVLFLFLLYQLLSDVYGQRENVFFRKDYKYIAETQSFYKIHTIHKKWMDAKRVCTAEGASLFYPEDLAEAEVVMKTVKETTPFHWVYIGVSDVFSPGVYATVDGIPMTDIYNRWEPGEPTGDKKQNCVVLRRQVDLKDLECSIPYPFVCKKTLDSLQWNYNCSMPEMDGQRENVFFRKDYKYIAETQSFYKIHTIHKKWMDAKRVCTAEGASLFYPEDLAEAEVVMKTVKETTPFHWVYIGVSDVFSPGVYATVDGIPMTDIYNRWEPGEPTGDKKQNCVVLRRQVDLKDLECSIPYPFVCKKTLDSLQWNYNCSMPEMDYNFDEELGKCYKFHLNPLSWEDAYAACAAEESYLAIIESQKEADEMRDITARAPKDNIQGNYLRGAVHLGFQNKFDEGWQTIRGVSLEQSGYSKWSYSEPDGKGLEKCGSMFYDGELNDIGCEQRMFFICEHDVDALNSTIDPRFNNIDDSTISR